MCNGCIINSLTTNEIIKYCFFMNIIQLVISIFILFFSFLCFIVSNLDLIIKTGYMTYINNILFTIIFILIIILLEFYRKKNFLIKDKKQISIALVMICICISIFKFFSSLIIISKVKHIYLLIKDEKSNKNNEYKKLLDQINLLFIFLLIILGLFFIMSIFWILYTVLIHNMRIIIYNDGNNSFYNRNNNSYMSTKPDIIDNSNEIIINNLNEGNKNNNFYFFSQNIINKFEKEYEDKGSQTIIKGIK